MASFLWKRWKKPARLVTALLLALLFLPLIPGSASAEPVDSAEWTVLIYLCGSDLETKDGMASFNLHEIMSSVQPTYTTVLNKEAHVFERMPISPEVNVVIETGGAKTWHNGGENAVWGLNISSDRLQRYALSHERSGAGFYPLLLRDEQPLQSMGEADALRDFIRWGVENYPARKYMLVLWDHGNGSLGLIIDDLFGGDTLYLHELDEALAAANVHFEAVLLDACMMSSLETAQILAPYADWMIASEELVSGYGTAFRQWLQALFQNPGCDGEKIGCVICDNTEAKYAALDDEHPIMQLTWSVIDLSCIERVSQAYDRLYEFLCATLEYAPENLPGCLGALNYDMDQFGTGRRFMRDLGNNLEENVVAQLIDRSLINELLGALDDAVEYTVNGALHSNASGLSSVFGTLTAQEREIFVQCCRSAPYLALMDAMLPDWEAPDWVYEKVSRLPSLDTISYLTVTPELVMEDGLPKIRGNQKEAAMWDCNYELYRLDEDSGELLRIGTDNAVFTWLDQEAGIYEYSMDQPEVWPAIDGVLCDIEFMTEFDRSKYYMDGMNALVYDIPIQLGPDQVNLRFGFWYDEGNPEGEDVQYKVYGLSQGYSGNISAPNRGVKSLSMLQGQEYRLLYPVYTGQDDGRTVYEAGEPMTMYRGLRIEEIPLPPGVYACDFVMENCFFQSYRTELIKMYWDGSAFSIRQ